MKKLLLRTLFILIPFLYSIYASAQPKNGKDCNATCFSTEVLSVERLSENCSTYELKVSFSGNCAHALSHFTVGIPCGKVENLSNSQNWKQVLGTDPTTGLAGFKIDDIPEFGETSLQNFTVRFDLCSADETCSSQLNCWQPEVAYKAATCVNYETLTVSCTGKTLKASLEKQDASCFGVTDGSLAVNIEDGQEPYAYLWSDNSIGSAITGLVAGDYFVIVRDATGAEVTLEASILQPEKISVSGTRTHASCKGVSDGAIELMVSGGAGEYTYLWNNGAETKDIYSLASGIYSVKVTDSKNCSTQATFSITGVSTINITAEQTQPDCNAANGAIDILVSGGEAPYSFIWSYNNMTTEDLDGLKTGLYRVTVTDKNGCAATGSYFLMDNNTLKLSGTTTPASCTGEATGSIDLKAEGGTEPYTFSWTNHEGTTEDLANLESGTYAVTVTDKNGCKQQKSFTITQNTLYVPTVVVQPRCHGDQNGSITLQTPIGGTAPYTYTWEGEDGQTATDLTGLGAGTYSVTVTDDTGCSKTISVTLKDPSEISASATVSNTQCSKENFFAVDLTVTGGTTPYSYEWSNGEITEDIDGLESGTYAVTITDKNGCSATKEIVVEGDVPSWNCLIDGPDTPPMCSSVNNELSTSVQDADSYSWTVESTDGNWSVSGDNSSTILFTAGAANSSAIFTLTIERGGCIKTCTYTVSACANDDGDTDPGEDPGNGEDGPGDQTCEACFATQAELIEDNGSCRTYEMVVSTNGVCRHELSHWTLAIPCGNISNYTNSEGWKMEFGKDPTTGLYGLKIDDINNFGKDVASFTVQFTLCYDNACEAGSWNPVVAYKAGQCVGQETVEISQTSSTLNSVSVYPNPFNEQIIFEWTASEESVKLEILDPYGNTVSNAYKAMIKRGEKDYAISLESNSLSKGIYYYRLTADGQTHSGKITKR